MRFSGVSDGFCEAHLTQIKEVLMRDAVPAPKKINGSVPLSGARRLVRRHQAALGILAAVSLAGQIAMQPALRLPQSDAPKVAQAARQEALAQHLTVSALAVQASQTPAQRTAWASDLRDTAQAWKQSAPLAAAAPHRQVMLDAAAGLLAALPPDGSREKVDVPHFLTPLMQHQKPLEADMEAVISAATQDAAAHLALLREAEAGLCLLMLLALTALGGAASARSGNAGIIVAALDAAEEKQGEISAALSEADRQIAQMRQTLENLSTVDALTGLKNHRAFQEQLDRELGRALRHNQSLSLLLLEVDQFKAYNDSYGHTEGDRALKLISGLLEDNARVSDIPARYGGKEFALILTETDMMGAVVLGERIRQAVAAADGLQRPLTASLGIATLTPMIFSAAEFVGQADRALAHAKTDGRNRVSHAHRISEALEDEAPVYARAA